MPVHFEKYPLPTASFSAGWFSYSGRQGRRVLSLLLHIRHTAIKVSYLSPKEARSHALPRDTGH